MRGSVPTLPAGAETLTDPPSYGSMPAMMLSRVDFPQPDGPTMLTNWPSSTVKLIASRTVNRPTASGAANLFVSLSTAMTGDAAAPCLCPGTICAVVSGGKVPSPGKGAPRPPAEAYDVDQDHHDHEARSPGKHHVDPRILEPVDQLLADPARHPERFGHQSDLPRQGQGDPQRRKDI